MSCKDCKHHKKAMNSCIMGRGAHQKRSRIMVVQDTPSYIEDRSGRLLCGDTKDKLNYFMEKAGIDYKEVFFTSAIRCRPKQLSDIKAKHITECSKYLFAEIVDHQPQIIITMGKIALQTLMDYQSVREFRGHPDTFNLDYESEIGAKEVTTRFSCHLMPTWGLNASINKWEYNDDIIRDFQKAKRLLDTGIIERTPEPKVNTILTLDALDEFVEKYRTVEYATTDFETTGFDFWRHEIINAGYCSKVGTADIVYTLPYTNENAEKWTKKDKIRGMQINKFVKGNQKKIWSALKQVNNYDHLKLILQNGKFDAKFAIEFGIPYANFWFDTLMADSLIDENLGHSLNIAMERRGINYGAYDTLLWKYTNKDEKKKKSYQYIPPPLMERYLGVDVDGCMRLFLKQVKELKTEGLVKHLLTRKMKTIHNVINLEYKGFKADIKQITDASEKIGKLQAVNQAKLNELTGIEGFNANSPQQVCNYMIDAGFPFTRLNIPATNTGFSTGQEHMSKFLKYKKWKDVPQQILNFKKLSKIKGTYIDGKDGGGGMVQYMDNEDRIHTSYNLHSPRTSRESSSSPSVQVWPRPIKGLVSTRNFVIPTDRTRCLFEADYSQLEQCVVASLSKDPTLVSRIQAGTDLHCINASDLGRILHTVPNWVQYEHMMVANDKAKGLMVEKSLDENQIQELLKDIEKHGSSIAWGEKRTQAKNIGFGLNYGKGASSFAKEFGITDNEAEDMVDGYFEIYNVMKKWRDDTVEQALTQGFVSLPSGRKRRFFGATDWMNSEHGADSWSTKRLQEEISRQAMNFPVQGGAHEVFEPALIRLEDRIRREGLDAFIMFRIHDGILGECAIEDREKIAQIIKEEMPHTYNAGTPLEMTLKVDIDFYEWEWYSKKVKLA